MSTPEVKMAVVLRKIPKKPPMLRKKKRKIRKLQFMEKKS